MPLKTKRGARALICIIAFGLCLTIIYFDDFYREWKVRSLSNGIISELEYECTLRAEKPEDEEFSSNLDDQSSFLKSLNEPNYRFAIFNRVLSRLKDVHLLEQFTFELEYHADQKLYEEFHTEFIKDFPDSFIKYQIFTHNDWGNVDTVIEDWYLEDSYSQSETDSILSAYEKTFKNFNLNPDLNFYKSILLSRNNTCHSNIQSPSYKKYTVTVLVIYLHLLAKNEQTDNEKKITTSILNILSIYDQRIPSYDLHIQLVETLENARNNSFVKENHSSLKRMLRAPIYERINFSSKDRNYLSSHEFLCSPQFQKLLAYNHPKSLFALYGILQNENNWVKNRILNNQSHLFPLKKINWLPLHKKAEKFLKSENLINRFYAALFLSESNSKQSISKLHEAVLNEDSENVKTILKSCLVSLGDQKYKNQITDLFFSKVQDKEPHWVQDFESNIWGVRGSKGDFLIPTFNATESFEPHPIDLMRNLLQSGDKKIFDYLFKHNISDRGYYFGLRIEDRFQPLSLNSSIDQFCTTKLRIQDGTIHFYPRMFSFETFKDRRSQYRDMLGLYKRSLLSHFWSRNKPHLKWDSQRRAFLISSEKFSIWVNEILTSQALPIGIITKWLPHLTKEYREELSLKILQDAPDLYSKRSRARKPKFRYGHEFEIKNPKVKEGELNLTQFQFKRGTTSIYLDDRNLILSFLDSVIETLGTKAIPKLSSLLFSNDRNLKFFSVYQLGKLETEATSTLQDLSLLLTKDSQTLQQEVLYNISLIDRKGRKFESLMMFILNDFETYKTTRRMAARCLKEYNPSRVPNEINKLLNDPNCESYVRIQLERSAFFLNIRKQDQILSSLIQAIKGNKYSFKIEAIRALADLGENAKPAVKFLENFLKSELKKPLRDRSNLEAAKILLTLTSEEHHVKVAYQTLMRYIDPKQNRYGHWRETEKTEKETIEILEYYRLKTGYGPWLVKGKTPLDQLTIRHMKSKN